ncbi:MAG TPA: riboflavin kinase, partial [Ktedonobacterales bacterium]|nr:riboflavin kinase [Ktedonobacterales bacterium]
RLLNAVLVLPVGDEVPPRPTDALLDTLCACCEPLTLVQGTDFALGDHRTNDVPSLVTAAERRGIPVERLDPPAGGEPSAGVRIRTLLAAGDVQEAARLLGHPYTLTGEVVAGDRRGRLLGFPTANLRLDARKALPAHGVYAVRVALPGEPAPRHAGVCNIGVRPTFGGEPRLLVEVHLLDAALDLYGLTLRVSLIARLRDERRFGGVDELKAQIARDAEEARMQLATPPDRLVSANTADDAAADGAERASSEDAGSPASEQEVSRWA